MDPISSNIQSKACDNPIGSNCVIWTGPAINGLCKGGSITDVLTSVSQKVDSCCEPGDFPLGHRSCYTGTWIDFRASIPPTGSSAACTWTVDTSTTSFGLAQYKWTKEGDIKVRGGFRLTVTPTTYKGTGGFSMVPLSSTCFPTGFTASQFAITAVDPLSSGPNVPVILSGGVALDFATGALTFGFSFSDISLTPIVADISLGCILNLA